MLDARTTMSAAAKHPYVINKVLFHAGGKDSFYGASSRISIQLHWRRMPTHWSASRPQASLTLVQHYFIERGVSKFNFQKILKIRKIWFKFVLSFNQTGFMNTIAYIVYLLLTYLITVHVGLRFYKNGRLYILNLLNGDEELTNFINRLLLVGYYLLNLGYAAIMISFWETITNWVDLFSSICIMTGRIMLTLGFIHFINMTVIYVLSKQKQSSLTSKKK